MDEPQHDEQATPLAPSESGGGEPGGAAPDTGEPVPSGHFLVSGSPTGIVAVDERGIVRSCNPAAEKLFARPSRDIVGRALGFPILVDEVRQIDVMLPDGSVRAVEMRVSTTTWGGQPLYITALHERLDQDSQAAVEKQATLIAVTAHELDSPLASIKLLAHELRNGNYLVEGRGADLIDRLDDCTRRMQAIVRNLRIASRIDTKQAAAAPELVPVFDFLLERLHELRERSQAVRLSCDPEVVAFVNRTEFAQMVDNYLRNALIHGQLPISLDVSWHRGWVEIRVCDHGSGVPEAFVPYLFQRFTRAEDSKKRSEGSGLGLWITRKLARAHGGDAWHETRTGYGACFCLRIPAQPLERSGEGQDR